MLYLYQEVKAGTYRVSQEGWVQHLQKKYKQSKQIQQQNYFIAYYNA
jgi:hypothetical protein